MRFGACEALVDGHVVEAIFSLCFTEDGGAMTLGTVEAAWAHEPLRYAPYTNGYYVPVHGVEMGGREVLGDLGRIIVDSGTTFSYFNAHQTQELRSAVSTACTGGRCGQLSGNCWLNADINAFPTFHFKIADILVAWGPTGYLYPDAAKWCS